MPAQDRKEATLINATDLATILQSYALVPAKQQADALALMVQMYQRLAKPKSVFKTGNITDFSYTYQQTGTDLASLNIYFYCLQVNGPGAINVYILPIGDADSIRITFGGLQCSALYCLSPSDANNPIKLSDFAVLPLVSASNASGVAEVPSSGNKYIHLIIYESGNDAINNILFNPSTGYAITYELLK